DNSQTRRLAKSVPLAALSYGRDSPAILARQVVGITTRWFGVQCHVLSPFCHPDLIIGIIQPGYAAWVPDEHASRCDSTRFRFPNEAEPLEFRGVFQLPSMPKRNFVVSPSLLALSPFSASLQAFSYLF